ncbi:MAG: putative ABC transporter permease, partial [Lachnospiraceae bacterium]|nr:putative ABC transporter permease [Lachnospiraceae bacterium]
MFGYTVEQWLFFFYFYCFFGWVFESTYVSLKSRHFVNRGFMHGPFLPLYGTGAIMMLVVSRPFADNILLTYIAGCIGATVLEYVTGAMMEAMFKVRYWDYSDKRFNIKGYICLGSTLAWGVLTILMTRVVHTQVESLVISIPAQTLSMLVFALTVYIVIDLVLSFKDAFALRDVLVKLEKVRQEAAQWQEKLAEAVDVAQEQLSGRKEKYALDLEQWKEKLPKPGLEMEQ